MQSEAEKIVDLFRDVNARQLVSEGPASKKKYSELLEKYNKCKKEKELLESELKETAEQLTKCQSRYQELAKIYDSFKEANK